MTTTSHEGARGAGNEAAMRMSSSSRSLRLSAAVSARAGGTGVSGADKRCSVTGADIAGWAGETAGERLPWDSRPSLNRSPQHRIGDTA